MAKTYDIKIKKTKSKNNKEEVKIEDYIKQIISENRD